MITLDIVLAIAGIILLVYGIMGRKFKGVEAKDYKLFTEPLDLWQRIAISALGLVLILIPVLPVMGITLVPTATPVAMVTETAAPSATSTEIPPEPTATPTPVPTQTATTPTPTATPAPTDTITPTPTVTPIVVVDTDNLVGWMPNFNSSKANIANNDIAIVEDALEFSYDVGKDGYVVITRNIQQNLLLDTEGISFLYKGSGSINSIELKLILRYPGDSADTTYGLLWNRATDTGDQWIPVNVLYSEMSCWWPAANCEIRGDLLNPAMVEHIDFVVTNKPGDEAGSGIVFFKEVIAIRP